MIANKTHGTVTKSVVTMSVTKEKWECLRCEHYYEEPRYHSFCTVEGDLEDFSPYDGLECLHIPTKFKLRKEEDC